MKKLNAALGIPVFALIFFLFSPFSLASSPSDAAQSYFEEASELNKQRRHDEAIEKLIQAVTLSVETHKYHQALHLTYIATRRGPQGIQLYKDLIRKNPNSGTLRYWLGRFYLERQSLEDAAREFREATRLSPRDEHGFISLGHVYLRLGKDQEALDAYLQSNKLSPRVAVVHVGIGNIYFKREDFSRAQKEYEEALELDPSFREARYNLGVIYEKKGQFSMAVKQWQTLVEEDPNESKARERLARLYFLAGEYLDAVREYATLSQVRQSSPEVFLALGEAQIMLASTLADPDDRRQLTAGAMEAFQRTLELDPKNAPARKYLDRLKTRKPSSGKK